MSLNVTSLKDIMNSGVYQSFFQNFPEAIFIMDLQGKFLDVNAACFHMTGYRREEWIERDFAFLYAAADAQAARDVFKQLLSGCSQPFYTSFLHKDGHAVHLQITGTPIVVQDWVVGLMGIARDVTDHKKMEQKLREREKRYESLQRYNPHGICSFDLHGNIQEVNSAFLDMTGYGMDELKGRKVGDIISDCVQERLGTGEYGDQAQVLFHHEAKVRHKSGRELEMLATNVPIIVDGVRLGHYLIIEDNSKVMETEKRLQISEIRYRQLVNNSLDAISIVEDGKWIFMNATGLKMFGAKQEEDLIGKSPLEFLHPDHHGECRERLNNIETCNGRELLEQKWYTLDGELFYAEVISIPYSDNALQLIMRDISERKKTEELLLKSEKLSAIGQLAASVAHEIRNPLTALKGFTKMLQEKPNESHHSYLEVMKSELDRIEMILSEMLVLAKPQHVSFHKQDVRSILGEVITLLQSHAVMENVVIETDFPSELAPVMGDEGQLKQVFVNLIKNGIEAMTGGGLLTIQVRQEGDVVKIQFTDNGTGIQEEHLEKLGEPFYSTKETGTGLGLMISQKIISSHEGTMEIASKAGQGTTVTITLPVAE